MARSTVCKKGEKLPQPHAAERKHSLPTCFRNRRAGSNRALQPFMEPFKGSWTLVNSSLPNQKSCCPTWVLFHFVLQQPLAHSNGLWPRQQHPEAYCRWYNCLSSAYLTGLWSHWRITDGYWIGWARTQTTERYPSLNPTLLTSYLPCLPSVLGWLEIKTLSVCPPRTIPIS